LIGGATQVGPDTVISLGFMGPTITLRDVQRSSLSPDDFLFQIAKNDFDGSGKSDILWQNADGTPAVWLMNGVNVGSRGGALANPVPAWRGAKAAVLKGKG